MPRVAYHSGTDLAFARLGVYGWAGYDAQLVFAVGLFEGHLRCLVTAPLLWDPSEDLPMHREKRSSYLAFKAEPQSFTTEAYPAHTSLRGLRLDVSMGGKVRAQQR